MRILLTNNEAKELEFCDIGLGYLAAGLIHEGHTVELLLRAVDEARFRRKLLDFRPDVVGIKVLSPGVPKTVRTIATIRETLKCVVAIGGPHVTGDPDNVLDYIPADYAFQGDGDRSLARFVTALQTGKLNADLEHIPGLIYRKNGGIAANPPDHIEDLDELSFPAWDLMPPRQHRSLVCKNPPAASVTITRGCTNKCSFCAEGGKRLRHRSVSNVMEEIHLLVKRFGVREIQFLDSNFLFSKRFIISFCEAVLHSDLDLAFCAPNGMRLESLDEEVCRLLARIGFYRANLGVESGSPEILRMVQKHAVPDQFRRKVPLLRKQGIYVVGNFMLGFPGETRDQMEQTLGLALSLDLSGANFAIYTPFPGTPLYEGLVKLGKLEANRTFRNYNYVTYDNELSALSARDLRRFRNWCAFRFLFRWRTVRTLAGVLKDRRLLGSIIKRVYGMYIQKLFTD